VLADMRTGTPSSLAMLDVAKMLRENPSWNPALAKVAQELEARAREQMNGENVVEMNFARNIHPG